MFRSRTSLDKGLDAFALKKWRRARRLIEDAAAEGDMTANGDYQLGLMYWRGLGGERDPRAATACFTRAARAGHIGAQAALGAALRSGIGAPRDIDTARALFHSAARAGNVVAMTGLGEMSEGAEARHWLGRAAEQAHAPAMRALGEVLMRHDPIDALSWIYAHAALTGNHDSVKRAAALARELSASEIGEAQKAGRAYVRNARHTHKR